MSDHLPECFAAPAKPMTSYVCICPALRACEQRVRDQDIATHHADFQEAKSLLASRDEAWLAGLIAAREAVAALPEYRLRDTCIAVIDELREGEK